MIHLVYSHITCTDNYTILNANPKPGLNHIFKNNCFEWHFYHLFSYFINRIKERQQERICHQDQELT